MSNGFATEMAMVIYLDDYRKALAARVDTAHRYDKQVLCVNWNPAVPIAASYGAESQLSPRLPEDLSTVDVSAFLDRVYALASQI